MGLRAEVEVDQGMAREHTRLEEALGQRPCGRRETGIFKGLREGLGSWSLEGEEWRYNVGLEGWAATRAPGPCRSFKKLLSLS